MTIELSKEELDIISQWYHSAAGESASGLSVSPITQWREEYRHQHEARMEEARKVKALLDKLGMEYDEMDVYCMKEVGLL